MLTENLEKAESSGKKNCEVGLVHGAFCGYKRMVPVNLAQHATRCSLPFTGLTTMSTGNLLCSHGKGSRWLLP